MQSIYDEVISVAQSVREDSQHRANTLLITRWRGEKPLNFAYLAWLT